MRSTLRSRRGFTIIEIITALTIIAIIGLAMTKLILGQTRSFQYENGARRSRAAARSAMNILITDLRMTQDSLGVRGVDSTNHRRVTVRVPTVFGFVCELTGSGVVVSLVPTDSFQLASSKYGGYAVRNPAGIYTYVAATSSDSIRSANVNRCRAGVNIYADTAHVAGRTGGVYVMSPAPPAITAIGSPVFVWQLVSYQFRTSTIYTGGGHYGLFRIVSGLGGADSTVDELIAPFKSTARFKYYMQNPYSTRDVPDSTAPTLINIRGFQIYLPAETPDTLPTRSTPQSTNATTAVFFKNTRLP